MTKAIKASTPFYRLLLAGLLTGAAAPALAQNYVLIAVPVDEIAAGPNNPAETLPIIGLSPIVTEYTTATACASALATAAAQAKAVQEAENLAFGTSGTGTALGSCGAFGATSVAVGATMQITQVTPSSGVTFSYALPSVSAALCKSSLQAVLKSLEPLWLSTPPAGTVQSAMCVD